jgi:predicted DCC family thiol-disulfide oxidoreductase YuxK
MGINSFLWASTSSTNCDVLLYYAHVCRCNLGMTKVMQRDTSGIYRFAALQSKPGQQLLVR